MIGRSRLSYNKFDFGKLKGGDSRVRKERKDIEQVHILRFRFVAIRSVPKLNEVILLANCSGYVDSNQQNGFICFGT